MSDIDWFGKDHVGLHRSYAAMGYEVFIYRACGGKRAIAEITYKEVEPHSYTPANMHLEETQAQALMDDLWRAGVRPTEGAGTAGSMRAVENHLRDMRAIVADKLKVDLK